MKISTSSAISILFCLIFTKSISQNNTKTVRVIDNLTNHPIKDVQILIKDSLLSNSNHLGYFQISAFNNDTLHIYHDKYEEMAILIPEASNFQIRIDVKEIYLDYDIGISEFYKHLARNLSYPKKARFKKNQKLVYVEIKIDSKGHSNITKIHGDEKNMFSEKINKVFSKIQGKWSSDYAGKIFLLPIKFKISSQPFPKSHLPPLTYHDRILSEVVVTVFN